MKTLALFLALLISLPALAEETDRMSMEKAKEKAKVAGAEAKRATKAAALTGKVKSALAADVGLKTVKINVDSDNGVVTLKGAVDSEDTRRRAEEVTRRVSGVSQVKNELRVKGG